MNKTLFGIITATILMLTPILMTLVDLEVVNAEGKHLKEILDPDGYEKIVSKCMEWDQEGYLDDNRLRL